MNQKNNFESPFDLHRSLLRKYSSSPSFHISKGISQIIEQQRIPSVLTYEDIEYFVDEEENMKRYYHHQEYKAKLGIFKQYYFYHEDCPRIFLKQVEIIYAKWQDRKRNLIYKRIKRLFDDSSIDSHDSNEDSNLRVNLLYDISEYNPLSKKYYLRVQDRKSKESQKQKEEREKVKSKDQISRLQHDLSEMLGDIKDLSAISTLASTRNKPNIKIFHRKSNPHLNSQSSHLNSQGSSENLKADRKFNFKRKKEIVQNQSKDKDEYRSFKSQEIRCLDSKSKQPRSQFIPVKVLSRNLIQPTITNENQQSCEGRVKCKSIFSTTAFNSLNRKETEPSNPARETLKINFQSKVLKGSSQYSKEKKTQLSKERVPSLEKIYRTQSIQKLNCREEKAPIQKESLQKLKTRPSQFCDYKINLIGKGKQTRASLQNQQSGSKSKLKYVQSNTDSKFRRAKGQGDQRMVLKL